MESSKKRTPSYGEAYYFSRSATSGRRRFVALGTVLAIPLFLANLFAFQELRKTPKVKAPSHKEPAYIVRDSSILSITDGPKVTIIIDDVGEDPVLLRELHHLPFPVTVSVLPNAAHCMESAEWAYRHGMEVMVHLPMEPNSFPEEDPGNQALMSSMSRAQIQTGTRNLLASVPHAVGTNNHMGSRFTQSRYRMNAVLDVVDQLGFFYIDSRTTASSVGYRVALEKRIPTAERTLFLDDVHDRQSIEMRLNELVETARSSGGAIGIGHLKPDTLAALKQWDAQQYSDIRFTFASESIR